MHTKTSLKREKLQFLFIIHKLQSTILPVVKNICDHTLISSFQTGLQALN